MIAKQLAVTINKNNTTAVSAASKPHNRLLKSKTFISKLGALLCKIGPTN